MSRTAARRTALEVIEEAVQLLRAAPAGALLCYYLGSVPCLLGLLYFWADMSRSAFAREHLIESALGVGTLYVWMKCWHAVFAAKLRANLLMEPEAPWTFARVARLVLIQTAVQPTGLFVRLFAAQILIPYVWTYSFYQNVTVLGDGTTAEFGSVIRGATRQAGLWQRQAHLALLCLFAFALFVWLNASVLIALLPSILKMFFGVETTFTRSFWSMLNTTFFATTFAATYLCFDPMRKALYVLRCFHGASLQSGDDLRLHLKTVRQRLALAAALLMLFAAPIVAAETPPRVESTALNQSLDEVLQRREYAWRLPREQAAQADEQKGWLTLFAEELGKKLTSTMKKIARWMSAAVKWFRKVFGSDDPRHDDRDSGRGINWSATARWTLGVLVAALLVLLGVMLWRWRKSPRPEPTQAQPLGAVPDLNEENVTADQLPEDGWLRLARALMQSGELRLALRASYLAGLAHLGSRELILLAKHKSNRDYDRELRRRARAQDELLGAFDRNLEAFERSWYGEHPVTSEVLGEFAENLDRIRAC
jgi:hypothetical protein